MFNDIPICFQRSGNGNTVFSTPSNPRFQRNNQRILSIETALPVLASRWIRCQLNFEKRSRLLILSGVPFQGTCISVIHLQQLHSSRERIHPISISNSVLIFNFSFSSSILPRKIEWLIFWNEKEGLMMEKKFRLPSVGNILPQLFNSSSFMYLYCSIAYLLSRCSFVLFVYFDDLFR